MELNVNFSEITLAAAKMRGLDAYLMALREAEFTFERGLAAAIQYIQDNDGTVSHSKGVTRLRLGNEEAFVFQLYEDIDRFYFET